VKGNDLVKYKEKDSNLIVRRIKMNKVEFSIFKKKLNMPKFQMSKWA